MPVIQNRLLRVSIIALLWIQLGFGHRISDDIIAHRRRSESGEEYNYGPYEEYNYYDQPQHHQFRNFRHFRRPQPHHLPVLYEEPHVARIDGYHEDHGQPEFFPGEHFFFDPRASPIQLSNPLKEMMDPMKKQMEEHIQQMGAVGEQIQENMRKPADELSKQMEDMKKQAGEVSTELPTPPGSPRKSDTKPEKGKIDETGKEAVKKGEKKEGDENPLKKLQNQLPSAPPSDIPPPPSLPIQMMGPFERITDETTEVRDEDIPQTRRMEWAPPEFVDIPYYHHYPPHDYVEY